MGEGALVAIISGSSLIIVAAISLMGAVLGRRLRGVHDVVNSRLDNALKTIEELKEEVRQLRADKAE